LETVMSKDAEKSLRKRNIFKQSVRETLAVGFWGYSIVKVFIYDVDIYFLSTYFPNASWVIRFKFLFMLGGVSIAWLFTKNKDIIGWFMYIVFYPFILFLWKVPRVLITRRSWIGAFAFIGGTLLFFKSLKFNIITSALLLIPFSVICQSSYPVALWISIGLLLLFLGILFFRSFYFAFKPSTLFQIQSHVINKFWDKSRSIFTPDQEVKDLPVEKMSTQQLQKWSGNLQMAVIFNRTCYFITAKLRDFQKSRINVIYYVLNFVVIVVLTVVVFGVANYGLYKIDSNSFSVSFHPRLFHFIYYSANTIFTNGIPDFYAVSSIARFLSTIEIIFGFLLLVILFFLVTTIQSSRHTEEVDAVVKAIRLQGEILEKFVESEYKMTVEQAIKELERIKAGLVKVIYYLSSYIERQDAT